MYCQCASVCASINLFIFHINFTLFHYYIMYCYDLHVPEMGVQFCAFVGICAFVGKSIRSKLT